LVDLTGARQILAPPTSSQVVAWFNVAVEGTRRPENSHQVIDLPFQMATSAQEPVDSLFPSQSSPGATWQPAAELPIAVPALDEQLEAEEVVRLLAFFKVTPAVV
jgi:hypothetical protein